MTTATHGHAQGEMHPQRWGDPARATQLTESARGMVEMVFGLDERPAVDRVDLPTSGLDEAALEALRDAVGAEHVLVDGETRRLAYADIAKALVQVEFNRPAPTRTEEA